MRFTQNARPLSLDEQTLVTKVFGATLPGWDRILVDDGLGLGDRPYTLDGPPGLYCIHIGPTAYPDCTSQSVLGDSRIDAIFIHEMTHVWQYAHGAFVKLSSIWSQARYGRTCYEAIPGKDWNSYNVEQQATLVETWFVSGMSEVSAHFPYIRDVIRARPATQ